MFWQCILVELDQGLFNSYCRNNIHDRVINCVKFKQLMIIHLSVTVKLPTVQSFIVILPCILQNIMCKVLGMILISWL